MITKPTLILDEQRCRRNIEEMCLKARENDVDFRPHFKTHQSIEIGNWFKEFGVNKITVSSLSMAEYFSVEWDDITVAFPVNLLEIETINKLAERIKLNLLIESVRSIEFLSTHLKSTVGVFIKIDVGYHRTGISPDRTNKIDCIINESEKSNLLEFKGFLSHAGHTYKCRNKDEIITIHNEVVALLKPLKNAYQEQYPHLIVSYGDTPSCSVAKDFSIFDELRPGNFVFYDLTQHQIGACEIGQIAVAMACPIVAVHSGRNEILIYGGGVHLSKERLEDEKFGTIYGTVVEKKDDSWGKLIPKMFVKSLSQEHGIVSVPTSDISNYEIGDYLLILPVHSCMTANLMNDYQTTENKLIPRL